MKIRKRKRVIEWFNVFNKLIKVGSTKWDGARPLEAVGGWRRLDILKKHQVNEVTTIIASPSSSSSPSKFLMEIERKMTKYRRQVVIIIVVVVVVIIIVVVVVARWKFPDGIAFEQWASVVASVTRTKLPNVYKSCPKMISLEKWLILTPLQKLPKNVVDLCKLIVAKGFKKLPKIQ